MPFSFSIRSIVAVVAGAVALGGVAAIAVDTAQPVHAQADSDIRVGVYDPQAVFNQTPLQEELLRTRDQISGQMQQAQQQGDQESMQQLQAEFQAEQSRIVGAFEQELERVLPGLAEERDITVVAVDVVYTADRVAVDDLTGDLATALGGTDVPEVPGAPLAVPQQ